MVSMRSIFEYLWQNPYRVIGFVACCAILAVRTWRGRKKECKRLWDRVAFPAMVCVIAFINPISTHLLVNHSEETQVLRFFWIAPVSILIVAVLVSLLGEIKKNYIKYAAVIVTTCLIFALGGQYPHLRQNTWKNMFFNPYKIPPIIVDVCDYILQDDTTEDKSLALTMPLNLWVRQYAPQIRMQFAWGSRATPEVESEKLYLAMTQREGQEMDLNEVSFWARELNITYVLLPKDAAYIGSMETNGYRETAAFQHETSDEGDVYGKRYLLYRMVEGR